MLPEKVRRSPEEHFFAGNSGLLSVKGPFLSSLPVRYPRKGAPILERLYDLRLVLGGIPARITAAAAQQPAPQKVLIIGVSVASRPEWMARVMRKLTASRHDITLATKEVDGTPRSTNLNLLLQQQTLSDFDWVVAVDDDVDVPCRFMDRFIFLMHRFDFAIAQPAHNMVSYASYQINLRHWGTIARQTGFVEVGPLVAFHRRTFSTLLPFPDSGMGWGLDAHWAHIAKQNDWRLGVIDALPIRHLRPIGGSYSSAQARLEATEFVIKHGGPSRQEALRTLRSFRTL